MPRSEEVRFVDVCTGRRVPALRIGVTDDTGPAEVGSADGPALVVADLFAVPLTELAAANRGTLRARFA